MTYAQRLAPPPGSAAAESHASEKVAQRDIAGSLQERLDNGPRQQALANLDRSLNQRPAAKASAAGQGNDTGLPADLKAGMEHVSGLPMDDVRVAYDSPLPAQLHGEATTQRTNIHIATGQEHHLPHELGHVVQQKQGRVSATTHIGKVPVNASPLMEQDADQIGAKALAVTHPVAPVQRRAQSTTGGVVQRATGTLSAAKGIGISVLKAVPRVAKRALNLAKHVTWDLGRALWQKGKNMLGPGAAVVPAVAEPLISQLPAIDAAAAVVRVDHLRRSQDVLSDIKINLHYRANPGAAIANIPPVPAVPAIPGQLNALDQILPNALPGVNAVKADIQIARGAYTAFRNLAPAGIAAALLGGVPAVVAGQLEGHLDALQDALAVVIDAMTQVAPAGSMQEKSPLLHWGAGLVTKATDVTGLKEILQGFTNAGGAATASGNRDLADDEKTSAGRVVGRSQDLDDIQLLENSHLPGGLVNNGAAFTVANTIHTTTPFGPGANVVEDTKRRGVLNHEILHVLQEQKQGMLSWIELEWGRRAASERNPHSNDPVTRIYNYGNITANTRFRDFSREQQGAIVQDYSTFLEMHARAGTPPVANEQIHGEQGHGTFGHYQVMLVGLTKGHWALPKQAEAWKQTLG